VISRHRPRRTACATLVLGFLLCASASAQTPAGTTPTGTTPVGQTDTSVAPPQQFAGLTSNGYITLFRSDSPGNIQGAVPVSGLQSGETLVGLAGLTATGRLYTLGSSNRVYVVNPITGVATALSNTPFSPPLNGQTFGFAIDPTTLQARTISNTGQDLRISVVNGQVAGVDSIFTYAPGDPGQDTTPNLAALAFSQPPSGSGASASLYAIDTARHVLTSSATNQATIRTIGPLGVDAVEQAALDITPRGVAYAALRPAAGENPRLYTIDLSTGAATPVSTDANRATIAYRATSNSPTNAPVIAMVAIGDAPADDNKPKVLLDAPNSIKASTLTKSGLLFSTSCNEACTVSGQLTVGKVKLATVTGAVLSTSGYVRIRTRVNSAARKALKADPTQGLGLRVTVTDAAGNAVTASRRGRTTG
jgi:hypothetical protein